MLGKTISSHIFQKRKRQRTATEEMLALILAEMQAINRRISEIEKSVRRNGGNRPAAASGEKKPRQKKQHRPGGPSDKYYLNKYAD